MPKQLEHFTADRLRSEFLAPLLRLTADFSQEIDRLDQAYKDGNVPRDYLELNSRRAQDAVAQLRAFLRREVAGKLDGALEGTYRWRDAERKLQEKKKAE